MIIIKDEHTEFIEWGSKIVYHNKVERLEGIDMANVGKSKIPPKYIKVGNRFGIFKNMYRSSTRITTLKGLEEYGAWRYEYDVLTYGLRLNLTYGWELERVLWEDIRKIGRAKLRRPYNIRKSLSLYCFSVMGLKII